MCYNCQIWFEIKKLIIIHAKSVQCAISEKCSHLIPCSRYVNFCEFIPFDCPYNSINDMWIMSFAEVWRHTLMVETFHIYSKNKNTLAKFSCDYLFVVWFSSPAIRWFSVISVGPSVYHSFWGGLSVEFKHTHTELIDTQHTPKYHRRKCPNPNQYNHLIECILHASEAKNPTQT